MCYSRDGEVAAGGRRYTDWQVSESLLFHYHLKRKSRVTVALRLVITTSQS
jgi:hypothetical protein